METKSTALGIGEKVYNFRKRANLSQMDLELKIGASPGMISRIESGQVNPTKETLERIIAALSLSPVESAYLAGFYDSDTTPAEAEKAKESVLELLSSPKTLSYLLDNKSRVIELSEGFKQMGVMLGIDWRKLIGESVVEIIFSPEIGLRKIIPKDRFDAMAISALAVLNQERDYLLSEEWWTELIARLSNYPDFNRLWKDIKQTKINLYLPESRAVFFEVAPGQIQAFTYHITNITYDNRFTLIEYIPNAN